MTAFPYLLNHGFVTYRDMVHAYPPLLITVLSLIYKFLSYSQDAVKISGWSFILISDFLIFLIIKKITNKFQIGIISLLGYVFLQTFLEGNMIWPDLAIIPFILASVYLVLNKKYFFSGILIGLAFLTKQTGALFIIPIFAFLILEKEKNKKIARYVVGVFVAIIPFLLILIRQNSFLDFLNWTIIYPSKYWIRFPGYVQTQLNLKQILIIAFIFIPIAFAVFLHNKILKDKIFLFLFLLLLVGIISVYPRFSFFHFQSAIAITILIYGYLFAKIKNISKFLFIFIIPFLLVITYFGIKKDWNKQTRFFENNNIVLASIIENKTQKDEKIYLLGLPANLYVLSNRLPPKPWLDNFGWYFEIPQIQENTLESWKHDPPVAIFWQNPQSGPWYEIGSYQPQKITNWIKKNYNREKEIQKGIWMWIKK